MGVILKAVRIACAVTALAILTSSGLRAAPPHLPIHLSTGAKLNVPLYGQQTNVWCWDASSLMVIKYFRPFSTLKQCDLANQATNVTNCCNNPYPVPCVHAGWEMLSNNGFGFSDSTGALSWDELRKQINSGLPVLYAWGWNGGGGHMMVAVGYYTVLDQHFVEINNPWPPPSGSSSGGASEAYTYAAWVGGNGYDHVFWHDWYSIVDKLKKIVRPRPLPNFPTTPFVPIGPGPVENAVRVPSAVINQAQNTLKALQNARGDVQVQAFGTRSTANAHLGMPAREFVVGLNSLQTYKAGMQPNRIVGGGNEYFFPVFINGRPQSAIRVIAIQGRAQTESIGGTSLARQLSVVAGKRLSTFSGVAFNTIKAPALGLYFVTRGQGAGLEIASLYDVPVYELRQGVFRSAGSVFSGLAAIARKQKGAM